MQRGGNYSRRLSNEFINKVQVEPTIAFNMKFGGTRYNSRWDASTWLLLLLVVTACASTLFIEITFLTIVLSSVFISFMLFVFLGIYYRIDGDKLIVYYFFMPSVFPIDKISEIKPTSSILAAAATSLTHRIAIKFSDRRVLKSTAPLIISPARQKEFIEELVSINPNIKY